MKKFTAIVLSLILVVTSAVFLASCSKNENEKENTTANQSEQGEITGGWTRSTSPEITNEFKKVFEKATETLEGVEYTPVAYLASQVVAGTNHKVLCKAQVVAPDTTATYAILTIYEDLQGGAEVTEIKDSDIQAAYPNNDGGWSEAATPVLDENVKAEFEKACETLTGMEYTPVAMLASQVVAGTNYRIICEATATVPNAETGYVIVTFGTDLDGNSQILETYEFADADAEQIPNSSVDNEDELDKLKQKYAIDDTYLESASENSNGYTEYCYEKVDKNGVVNPYDALKVTIDTTTGEVLASKRFDNAAFIEAKIDEKTAKDKAAAAHSNSTVNLCELVYYMPDYPKGDVLLTYKVVFGDGNTVYVNAVSGDIAGSDQTK